MWMSTTHPSAIFGPVFATVLLTLVVWTTLYVRRIGFIRRSGATPKDLAVPGALAAISSPQVSNPSDNLKNLFEIPVLFYALALLLYVTDSVDAVHVASAWTFVAASMSCSKSTWTRPSATA